ncbi:ankyrin repeat domain-containing protein [Gimesia aquarii]|uniref:ankyrin repeat domain-containing protein n=1 Tax=Gimesia aquarii TaxID=2527964 RepID=UPI0011A1C25E|nr:ankyrin repeat domain-containing protein [Gimesia aquarii]
MNRSQPDSLWSLMHIACENQNESLIRALFTADSGLLNTRAACGYPPIFQALDIDIDGAIQSGHPMTFETTRLMLELGADPNLKDQKQRTLRELAQVYGELVVNEFDNWIASLLD